MGALSDPPALVITTAAAPRSRGLECRFHYEVKGQEDVFRTPGGETP